jgi:cyclopropane-fatty-acyl-phospholipid synthase
MPSEDLLSHFQDDLSLLRHWRVEGTHYGRTADAWLANLDRQEGAIRPILAEVYGARGADLWLMRWRLFFMACAELFNFAKGEEWFVSHYLFGRR